jgi:Large polyvalent protein associated domain 23
MNDQFPPPAWSLRPEHWMYRLPGTVFSRLPASWAPQLSPIRTSDTWDESTPAGSSPDTPTHGGILGQFSQPIDPPPVDPWSQVSSLPGWNSPTLPSSSTSSVSATSAPENGSWYRNSPSWIRSAMPFGANVGFSAAPSEPAYRPWTDPLADGIGRSPWDRPPRFASPVQLPPVLPMHGPEGWHYPGAQLDPTPPAPPKDFRTRLLEALSDENIRYYAGPHLYEALRKFAPLAQLLPGSGTVQSTEDGAKAGEEFESGNYGSAAAHVGMGMGNAALDWFPPAKFALLAGMSARTFPWLRLPIAEAMEKAGRSTDEIWRATGLERDITGHWRFEISDKGYRVNPKAGTLDADGYRVARLFEQQLHPGLREAYPGLAEAKSKILIDPMKERAWFRPGLVGFEVPIKSVLQHYGIHELQHMIDYLEKLPRGGSMAEFTKLGFSKAEAEDLYNRLVGEVVARNAQFRWRRDETYRQWNSPMSTEGMSPTSGIRIPRDRQIIHSYSDLFP